MNLSQNLVPIWVTYLSQDLVTKMSQKMVTNSVSHQIWWQICHHIWWQIQWVSKFGDKFFTKLGDKFSDHQIRWQIRHQICHQIPWGSYMTGTCKLQQVWLQCRNIYVWLTVRQLDSRQIINKIGVSGRWSVLIKIPHQVFL